MKIRIDQSDVYSEIEIDIKCPTIDHRLEQLLSQIKKEYFTLKGKHKDRMYSISINDIYYIESIDDKTFAYKKDKVLEVNERLYELEESLKGSSFIRISKSCILNIDKLHSVKALLNGKYEAVLDNNEIVIVTRHYVPIFKKKFGI